VSREAGFTLLEMLIATAITGAVLAGVAALLTPAHGMHQVQAEMSDLQQRLRVATESLRRDLAAAGAGLGRAEPAALLMNVLPPILPYRDGELRADAPAGVFFRPDAVTILYVPATAARTAIADATPVSASELLVTAQLNCGAVAHEALCGFNPGTHAVVADSSGAWDVMTVASQDGPVLSLQHRRLRAPNRYARDAAIAEAAVHTYYLESDERAGTFQLRHYDGFQTDMPLLDDVVGLRFDYFGDPEPPRIRRGAVLDDPAFRGLVTTYGPRPPAVDVDRESDTWPRGENCVFAVADGEHVPRLPVLAADAVPVALPPAVLQDGPWCPDGDHPYRYDADLLRIRRVRVTVRVQAAGPLRGPSGPLFARAGTATAAHRFVPDQELTFDVAPRNMAAAR
jgi:prepilin-type N-terminal cleavage/methylation domain-containing protein